jgi:V/A-type H+-transporting ATPase subunit D
VLYPVRTVNIAVGQANIMSVNVPKISVDEESLGEIVLSYGLVQTSSQLDGAIAGLANVLPQMLRLAEIEKTCNLLADEIEKTRRRVNALEYVMIPDLNETIRFIAMKLDENERGALTRLMKVKDMIAARDQA